MYAAAPRCTDEQPQNAPTHAARPTPKVTRARVDPARASPLPPSHERVQTPEERRGGTGVLERRSRYRHRGCTPRRPERTTDAPQPPGCDAVFAEQPRYTRCPHAPLRRRRSGTEPPPAPARRPVASFFFFLFFFFGAESSIAPIRFRFPPNAFSASRPSSAPGPPTPPPKASSAAARAPRSSRETTTAHASPHTRTDP